jgi:hypothetical protein
MADSLVVTVEVQTRSTNGDQYVYPLTEWTFPGVSKASEMPEETFEMLADEAASALRQLPLSGRLV